MGWTGNLLGSRFAGRFWSILPIVVRLCFYRTGNDPRCNAWMRCGSEQRETDLVRVIHNKCYLIIPCIIMRAFRLAWVDLNRNSQRVLGGIVVESSTKSPFVLTIDQRNKRIIVIWHYIDQHLTAAMNCLFPDFCFVVEQVDQICVGCKMHRVTDLFRRKPIQFRNQRGVVLRNEVSQHVLTKIFQ